MEIVAREMVAGEINIVIDYFHSSTPEHLEMLGVDPTRLPPKQVWKDRFGQLFATPIETRSGFYMTWLADNRVVGFSSCDKIVFGDRANMHLHVTQPEHRKRGVGTQCVLQTVEIYFRELKLKQLFCEPNAFNVGPNRTLQRAGFKYLKTHMTVPGPLNYHQAVTRWVVER
jgi:RimJ/RimL family protein N-acetyltransferase